MAKANAGSFNADTNLDLHINVDDGQLVELVKTLKTLSQGNDLKQYWKNVDAAIQSAQRSALQYKKNINSTFNAKDFVKNYNALKAITQKDTISDLFPDIDNIDTLFESAKKLVPDIASQFSSKTFSQVFQTLESLESKGLELDDVFKKLQRYNSLEKEVRGLRQENFEFRDLIGDEDIEKLKSYKNEVMKLREEYKVTFSNFLLSHNISPTDDYGYLNFEDYFQSIEKGTLTASEAIQKFKNNEKALLESKFELNDDTFNVDYFQEFSNKLEQIFSRVEDIYRNLDEVITNGIITKNGDGSSFPLFDDVLENEEKFQSLITLIQKVKEELNIPNKSDISSENSTVEVSQNDEVTASIRKKKEELASYELQLEETRYEIEKLAKSENESFGFKKAYSNMNDNYINSRKEALYKSIFGTDKSTGQGSMKYQSMDFGGNVAKGYAAWREELERLGYTLSELRQTNLGFEADIIPIDGKAITNAEEFRKALFGITTVPSDNIELLNKQITELELKISSLKSEISSLESSKNSPMKDVFQGDSKATTDASTTAIKEESQALEQVSTSAKEAADAKRDFAAANKEVKSGAEASSISLDEEKKKIDNVSDSAEETKKKLDDVVFKPNTEGFDEIVSKLDIAKNKIEEISKITKSSVWSESQGEYLESYNIKYKNGTSEIRGESSNKKGSNVLRANEVAYDAKAAQKAEESKKKSEAKAIETEWKDAVQALKKYEEAQTELNNLKARNKDGSNKDSIAGQEQYIKSLQASYESARQTIASFFTSVDKYRALLNFASQSDIDDTIERLGTAAEGSAKSVNYLSDEMRKASQTRLDGVENTLKSFQSTADKLAIRPDGQHSFASWTNQLTTLNTLVKEFDDKVDVLRQKDFVSEDDVNDLKALEDKIKSTIATMNKVPQAQRGFSDISVAKAIEKINKILQDNTRYSQAAKDGLKALIKELEANPKMPVEKYLESAFKIQRNERAMGREGKSLGSILKDKVLYGFAGQLAGMFGIYDVINIGKQAFSVIKDLDSALTEMRKVSDETTTSLKNFQQTSFDIAQQVGVTALEIQNSTSDFMKLGYSLEEASKLSEDANIYANVGDMEIDEATEHMISSIQAWKSEFSSVTEASTNIIDRYNEVGNRFAITSADIGSAMERSAAALKAGGNTLNESIGIITAGNLIQQDADTTANAIKVLSLRIRGSKSELEQMGEETDNLASSTSKLRSEIKALTGVDIMENDKTYKSTAKIIQEIGAVFNKLDDVSQAATLELLAGKTRASTVAGLLENYQTIGEVMKVAEQSENSAREENEKYMDSMEGRINILQSQLQELAFASFNSDTAKNAISFLTTILDLVTNIVDTIGIVPTILPALGGILGQKTGLGKNAMPLFIR